MDVIKSERFLSLALKNNKPFEMNELGGILQDSGIVRRDGILPFLKELFYVHKLIDGGISFSVEGVRYNLALLESSGNSDKYNFDLEMYPF